MKTVRRKSNAAGYFRGGQFFPIRSGKLADGKKAKTPYLPELAGDFDDIFDKEIRREKNRKQSFETYQKQIENQIRREMFGESELAGSGQTLVQFVRSEGGIKRSKSHRGNLEFLSFKESRKRGLVSDTKGKTLDYMYQAATEAGYDVQGIDDLLDKLDDEIRSGKATYITKTNLDYRDNPKKTMKRKLTEKEIKAAAKTLAKAFPDLEASQVVKKLRIKRNPSASSVGKAALETFDVDFDKELDAKDIEILAGNEPKKIFVKTKTGQIGEVLTADRKGRLVVEFRKNGKSHIEIVQPAKVQILENPKGKAKSNPLHPLQLLATGAGGILSALQINQMLKKQNKPKTKRKANPTETAFHDKQFDLHLAQIERGDFNKIKSAKLQGKLAGYSPSEVDILVQRARLTAKLKNNPSKVVLTQAETLVKNGAFGRFIARRKAASAFKKELRLEAALERARKRKQAQMRKATGNPTKRQKTAKNPTMPRRPKFEEFQGRKATNVKPLPISRFAGENPKVDQLGDLIEIKLNTGEVFNFANRKRNPFKLCARRGKLWIVGGTFATPNPKGNPKKLDPLGEVKHIVYGTYKPHHGDHKYTHYIHHFGEVSGKMPILAVDAEGFPVMRGGNYTIQDVGIVD